jgi:hypothetical protein
MQVWSSSNGLGDVKCGDEEKATVLGHVGVFGGATTEEVICVAHTETAAVRCCADVECIPEGEGKGDIQMVLVEGVKSTVRIASRQNHIEVYIDGELKCSEPREHTQTFANAHVYASDPWTTPADAVVDNFYLRPGGGGPAAGGGH